jgi:hypothetical protein
VNVSGAPIVPRGTMAPRTAPPRCASRLSNRLPEMFHVKQLPSRVVRMLRRRLFHVEQLAWGQGQARPALPLTYYSYSVCTIDSKMFHVEQLASTPAELPLFHVEQWLHAPSTSETLSALAGEHRRSEMFHVEQLPFSSGRSASPTIVPRGTIGPGLGERGTCPDCNSCQDYGLRHHLEIVPRGTIGLTPAEILLFHVEQWPHAPSMSEARHALVGTASKIVPRGTIAVLERSECPAYDCSTWNNWPERQPSSHCSTWNNGSTHHPGRGSARLTDTVLRKMFHVEQLPS